MRLTSTFAFLYLLVRYDLLKTDDIFMTQLTQDFDFSDGSNRKTFFLVLKPDFFESELFLIDRLGNSLWCFEH